MHQGFKIVTYFRFCQYLDLMGGGFSVFAKIICNRISVIYSIDLSPKCQIEEGLLFDHAGPRVINSSAIIGKHCIIHTNVLIGGVRGKGAPIIGDNVFIGKGAKIIGNCRIEDWCFISPGSIITKDVPEGSLVGSGLNCILNLEGKNMF